MRPVHDEKGKIIKSKNIIPNRKGEHYGFVYSIVLAIIIFGSLYLIFR